MAQFTKYTGAITGEAGSLITVLDAVLVTGESWTKEFTGTNKAVYRAPSGNRFYLRVQDDGPGAGGAREARITGYETMSDVDTGTNPFPTAAQGVGSTAMLVARKSSTLDATDRDYRIFADERTMLMAVKTGDSATTHFIWTFGEISSYKTSSEDVYRTFISGRGVENNAAVTSERVGGITTLSNTSTHNFMARSYTGAGTSLLVGKHTDYAKGNSSIPIGVVQAPNGPDGGFYCVPMFIHEAFGIVRGQMRGVWVPMHPLASANDGDTFSGVGALSGKTFEILSIVQAPGGSGHFAIETSDTLETN